MWIVIFLGKVLSFVCLCCSKSEVPLDSSTFNLLHEEQILERFKSCHWNRKYIWLARLVWLLLFPIRENGTEEKAPLFVLLREKLFESNQETSISPTDRMPNDNDLVVGGNSAENKKKKEISRPFYLVTGKNLLCT